MGINIKVKEDSRNDTSKWINNVKAKDYTSILNKYGRKGVQLLSAATPKDTGKTSESWSYEIQKDKNNTYKLLFSNSNVKDGWANVAILLQYGHSSRNGTWVEGRDYINPALTPLFDSLTEELSKEFIK